MNSEDRIILELTHEQAEVLERAAELLFRIHIGQLEEIGWELRDQKRKWSSLVNTQMVRAATDMLRAVLFPDLRKGESYNIDTDEACQTAYNIFQAVRYVVAWHANPEGGLGVNFDPPLPNGLPIPKCYVVEGGADDEDDG